ncbi:MAG: hypothetical protein E7052_10980 [Lentisphaerae bacterium]|nr:hypothetical protein [Lentisphaerota bacterium]
MIIDFHTHFYPEKIVERALATAREKAKLEPALNGTRKDLLRSMQHAGIDYSVSLPIVTSPGKGAGLIKWAAGENTPPIIMLGSVHPRDKEFAETLQLAQNAGLCGIKVHPEYQSFSFDEIELDPVWDMISNMGLFLITHAGEDAGFAPPFHSDPKSLRKLHERHPHLKLVLAHGGSWKMWDEVKQYLAGCDIFFDLSFVGESMPCSQYRDLISLLGVENCLFGTDSPWCDQVHALELLHDTEIGSAAEEMIHAGNAVKLLKI